MCLVWFKKKNDILLLFRLLQIVCISVAKTKYFLIPFDLQAPSANVSVTSWTHPCWSPPVWLSLWISSGHTSPLLWSFRRCRSLKKKKKNVDEAATFYMCPVFVPLDLLLCCLEPWTWEKNRRFKRSTYVPVRSSLYTDPEAEVTVTISYN